MEDFELPQLPQVPDEEPMPPVPVQQLPQISLPQVPDEEPTPQENFFSGQLRTNAPSYLLDPSDFTVLENYRYTPMGIKGRYGMSEYSTTGGYIVPHVKKDGSTVIHYRTNPCTYCQVEGDLFIGDTSGIYKYNYSTPAWEALLDNWSGDWLYPNGAVVDLKLDDVKIKDYTGFVYLDNTSTYLEAGELLPTDGICFGFMDVPSEIWIDLVPDAVNTEAATMTLSCWTGAAYADTTETDGTTADGNTLAQSGQLTDITTTGATTSIKYGIPHELYWFRIEVDIPLSETVNIWQVRAKPVSSPPVGYNAVVAYKQRLWLYGNDNIFAYSKRNYPETWNGKDSGVLEIGENQPVSYAQPFYNEMTVYKRTGEVGIVEGYSPATFAYELLASYSGAVASRSIVPVETGVLKGEQKGAVTVYLSSDGFRMCNGLSTPLISQSVSAYFDQNDTRCIAAADMNTAVAWMDYQNKEYHCAVPNTGEFVYDFETGKWTIFKRPVTFISAATFYSNDQWLSLASTAAKVYKLEDGETDDTVDIDYLIETKDLWESEIILNYRGFLLFAGQYLDATLTLSHALDSIADYTVDGTIDVAKLNHKFCAPDEALNLTGSSIRWKLETTKRLELYRYVMYVRPVREIKEQPGN